MTSDKPLLKHRANPCDIDRLPALAPVGDMLAAFFESVFRKPTHDCPCCMAVRVIILAAAAYAAGYVTGAY